MKLRLLGWAKAALGVRDVRTQVRPGVTMDLDEHDFVQREILFHGAYERETIERFIRLIADATVFVDIGAHVGQYSLLAAAQLAGRGDVFAFEPTPKTAARLLHNIALSGLTNVQVFTVGISDAAGFAHMAQPHALNWGGTQIQPGRPAGGGHAIATAPLAEIARFCGWRRIDIVKIDVEGHEPQVLRSLFAPGVPRPRHILLEFKPSWFEYEGRPANIPSVLAANGYRVRDVTGQDYVAGQELPDHNLWAEAKP